MLTKERKIMNIFEELVVVFERRSANLTNFAISFWLWSRIILRWRALISFSSFLDFPHSVRDLCTYQVAPLDNLVVRFDQAPVQPRSSGTQRGMPTWLAAHPSRPSILHDLPIEGAWKQMIPWNFDIRDLRPENEKEWKRRSERPDLDAGRESHLVSS